MLKRIRRSLKALLRPEPPQSPRRDVELFRWRPKNGEENFGDHLSSAIVTSLAASREYFLDEIVPRPRRLLAIGSILQYATAGDVVWGTGWNGNTPRESHSFPSLDVRAVRGPLTGDLLRSRGIEVPAIYGDPALLTRALLGERFKVTEIDPEPLLIPHFTDLSAFNEEGGNIVSPYEPWQVVIQRIVNSRLVISSSLHGLVVADAYSVPCIYLRLSEHESFFKFEDYVLGSSRGGLSVATSMRQAYRLSPIPAGTPDLALLRRAFPWDLWK